MLETVETSGWVLMISKAGRTVCAVVCTAPGNHPVDDSVVHQHCSEVRHVVHDLARLLQRYTFLLAELGVLFGELITQLAGARVHDNRRRQVDTQFGCTRTYLSLLPPEDSQIGDTAHQQPSGRLQDAVVVPPRAARCAYDLLWPAPSADR